VGCGNLRLRARGGACRITSGRRDYGRVSRLAFCRLPRRRCGQLRAVQARLPKGIEGFRRLARGRTPAGI
jgi:hypothetical protein